MSAIQSFYTEYNAMNQVSGYDPNIFLGATLTQANTRRPPIPGGTTLIGTFGKPTTRQTEGKKETNMGVIYNWVDIPVEFDLTQKPDILQIVGQEKVTLTHSFMLDVGAGGLDMAPGKNNGLRHLRDALDMNKEGEPFQMLAVEGRRVLCMIKSNPYQGEIYDQIGSIAHI